MKKLIFSAIIILSVFAAKSQTFRIENSTRSGLELSLDIENYSLEKVVHEDIEGQAIILDGIFLPNRSGMPDLPVVSRYVAIPRGAEVSVNVKNVTTETVEDVDIMPAPELPLDDDKTPMKYECNELVYNTNAYFPEQTILVSEPTKIRDVDVVIFSVTPFQYNPVTKELIVTKHVDIELNFEGGSGDFGGDPRYLNPAWEHIVSDMVINADVLPQHDYQRFIREAVQRDAEGCEYLIITPDNADFIQLADSIRLFRNQQGVLTKVVTLDECGGNNSAAIHNYIKNAYNNWDVPVSAVLLLGDHNTDETQGIVSYTMNNHPGGSGYNPYISDNRYGDMNNDDLPDVAVGRITGRDFDELYHMINKDLQYERHPTTNPHFYDKPVTAMGFQLERWFQLCSEVVNGFWEYGLGKHPVRLNAIYEGNPGSLWSTADNTNSVVNYFGPNGLGYIPQTMSHLTEWDANSNAVNAAINAGAFIIQHRDHGAEELWGEPSYSIGSINRLVNPDLTYVMSNNCLTGKFNYGGQNGCFAEAFHRHQHGALGLIAATEVSYSFLNDVYVWGVYDNMWPEFMPDYGSTHPHDFILPAYGNAAGKFYLRQSGWTGWEEGKEITYYLFHHHGDVYMNLYSEMPQYLTVTMLPVVIEGATEYNVTADEGSTICLTANGEIIGLGIGTGASQTIEIIPQELGTEILLTITKQNYYRYSEKIAVIPDEGPYLIFSDCLVDDENGKLDFNDEVFLNMSLHNVGFENMNNVNVELTTESPYIEIISSSTTYESISVNEIKMKEGAFRIKVSNDVPDQTKIVFNLAMTDGTRSFTDNFVIVANAPVFKVTHFSITDAEGDPTDRLYKGETSKLTFTVNNIGHSNSNGVKHTIHLDAPVVTYEQYEIETEGIQFADSLDVTFVLTIDDDAPFGAIIEYSVTTESDGYTEIYQSDIPLGNCIENFENDYLNPDFQWNNSGSSPWVRNNEDPYEGDYCYTSTSNSSTKQSRIVLGVETEIPDNMSFYYKSSDNEEDSFSFTLNNTRYELTGNDWQLFELPIAAGKYVMKWVFSRTSNAEHGAASIDLIKLPPMHVEITSIEEDFVDNESDNMTIYPNPGDTELNILIQEASSIQVFDFQGRMIFEKESDDNITTISTSTWESGIYLIKAGKNTQKWLKK